MEYFLMAECFWNAALWIINIFRNWHAQEILDLWGCIPFRRNTPNYLFLDSATKIPENGLGFSKEMISFSFLSWWEKNECISVFNNCLRRNRWTVLATGLNQTWMHFRNTCFLGFRYASLKPDKNRNSRLFYVLHPPIKSVCVHYPSIKWGFNCGY